MAGIVSACLFGDDDEGLTDNDRHETDCRLFVHVAPVLTPRIAPLILRRQRLEHTFTIRGAHEDELHACHGIVVTHFSSFPHVHV